MKVLYIATAFPRSDDDIITPWLVEAIKRLKKRGIDVDVYTSSYKGLPNQNLFNINIFRFRYFLKKWENLTHEETAVDRVKKGLLNKLKVPFYLFCGTTQIYKLCRNRKYDIIHTHWPLPHALFGYVASQTCKAKHFLYFHGVELMWVRKELPFLKPFLRWAISKANVVMCNSSHTASRIKEIYEREVVILPSGQSAKPEIEIPLQKTKITACKNILFVGRLVERKGVKYLIEAFAQIANSVDAVLNIVGTGPEKPLLEKLVQEKNLSEKVKFWGQVSSQELNEQYQNCDVFVLPAIVDSKGDTEGLGVVLIEALTYKKPVIATNVGGIIDIIKHNETGLLVPEKNSGELAKALLKIIQDESLARRLAEQGYNYVNTKYNWNNIIDQMIEAYYRSM
ncbi:MAG: glycosyltransferase family 4 protein [candidate division WOR-3 bacterium]|nr:glycosyltransferase family 4 protein [candidate division WOR-3 bacterium]